ncbi:MAG: TonB family protein [Myxococcaceae bacterium]|nr:TonB family protein [Myxococcaceae bacterium]MCI0669341.1 TonB family protein [Myxococcaceae bacterium]
MSTLPPNAQPTSPPPSEGDPLIGRTFNQRFKVLEPLGSGGMGKVYRALQLPLGRVVALKVLQSGINASSDPQFLERFLREAALTSRLRHPNTVTVIDYGRSEDGIPYIAMEYLEGRTLAQELQRAGALPWQRAVEIAQQVCRSLREAHRLGVVHRDLKPANVMLLNEADGTLVKVLDFGLVKSIAPEQEEKEIDLTRGGIFLGSPRYMAPEQARNTADARSDVYSLGVLLYQMLCGRTPFTQTDALDLIIAHHKEAVPPIRMVRPDLDVPPVVEAVVMRCLQKAPAARYASMDALLEALREASGQGGTTGAFTRPPGNPTGSHAAITSGAHTQPTPSAGLRAPGLGTGSFSRPVPGLHTGSHPMPARRRSATLLVVAVVGVSGVAFGLGALLLLRGEPAPVAAVPSPAEQAAAPAPSAPATTPDGPVRFRVDSIPQGARVVWEGKERGVTPLVLEVAPGPDGVAMAEFTFLRDGYVPDRVTAGGRGEVLVTQRLQQKPASGVVPARGVASAAPQRATPETAAVARPASAQTTETAPAPATAPSTPAVAAAGGPAPAPVVVAASTQPAPLPEAPAAARAGPISLPEGAIPPREEPGNAPPEFPDAARASGKEGMVVLKVVITVDGTVGDVKVMSGEEPFVSAASSAVRTWRYRPAFVDGRAVTVYRVLKIPFRLRR